MEDIASRAQKQCNFLDYGGAMGITGRQRKRDTASGADETEDCVRSSNIEPLRTARCGVPEAARTPAGITGMNMSPTRTAYPTTSRALRLP